MTEDAASASIGLVVIGASAGGIDALGELLGPIEAGFSAPIVVAQHTQPSRASHLAEILAARTRLKVVLVQRRERLKPGTVYVVPSDHHVLVTDHVVEARAASGDRPSPSIDRLLATAAEVYGERLIAVILTGMGTDGVVGAGEVKARGGTVIIQNPETAAQPSMPRALPPTLVDFVANAERMGELLGELVTLPVPQAEDDERLLAQFLERVRERTGIDFSAYKRPTIMRRLQRRMVATANPKLRDYVRYVNKHPEEFGRLSSAFLIKVTQFFRDTDLFEYLGGTVLPTIIDEARGRGRELRVWSAGCATGEEAYSLAILVAETLGEELESFTVRIFATDLDEEAIAFARRGVYPGSAMDAVRPELLERFFVREGDQYEIVKDLRSMVVFGQHDLGQRAPFPRIDLALCRNVLIYFTGDLQKRALQLFAFSLREGGYLVLGKSESSTPYAEHFVLDQPRLKVYRRAGERVLIPPARIRDTSPVGANRSPARREPEWATDGGEKQPPTVGTRRSLDRADDLLLRLPVGVVVIDEDYDISFVNAAARRLLGIHGTALGADFVHLAHQLPSDEIRAAVSAAIAGEPRVVTRPLPIESDDGDTTHVQLLLQPQRALAGEPASAVVITVLDVSEARREHRDLATEVARNREDRTLIQGRLERITRSNRELLQANEEMTNANAGLQITNEELVVANEEVQAATEEVETLNEELQATNEELETLNEELQATNEELNTTNDDLEVRSAEVAEAAASLAEQRQRSELERERLGLILDGMSEAVLVVDRDRRIVASNRAYDTVFGTTATLVPEDGAGNPLPEDEWPQLRAAAGESFSMSFTHVARSTDERRWYEATGRVSDGESGTVIVIRDITDRSLRHLQERFIDTASHELQTPLAALRNYLTLVDRAVGDEVDEPTRRYLKGALEQSRRLGELASRLFDVSVIRHGRTVVQRETVDLGAIVAESVAQSEMADPGGQIDLRLPTSKAMVEGDPMRLRQLFGNLLTNAMTHGSSSEPVQVTVERLGRDARVTIADRGRGVPEEVRQVLFTPFSPGAPDAREGLGLGLYLAQTYATEHGGTVSIEARDGGGTVARLTLPLSRRRSAATAGSNPRGPAGRADGAGPEETDGSTGVSEAASRPASAPRRRASGRSRR